jgi:hypothetical protein
MLIRNLWKAAKTPPPKVDGIDAVPTETRLGSSQG